MKSSIYLIAMILFSLGLLGMKTDRHWCDRPLQQGDSAFDTAGKLFVLDGSKLRKFSNQEIVKHYPSRRKLSCIMNRDFKNLYERGDSIYFPPEQDFEKIKIFKVRARKSLFMWIDDQVFPLKRGFKPKRYWEEFFTEISEFEWQNLPRSKKEMDEKLFSEMAAKKKLYPVQLSGKHLIYSLHRERIYLIKKGKRYRFWSSVNLLRLGYGKDSVKKVKSSVLYSIPFGGYIF